MSRAASCLLGDYDCLASGINFIREEFLQETPLSKYSYLRFSEVIRSDMLLVALFIAYRW